MGISGLLPLLKEISVTGNIKEFAGKRLAVDAYVWLHKGAFGCAEDLVKGKRTTKFVDYAMYRVRLLKHHGITPYIVFDGGPLPAKKGTEVSRAKSRAENLARATSLESQGRQKEARDYYTKCVDITPEMAYQLIKALRAEGVEYVVAPYEADAQLYYLEREGYVDGIITEDSDLLVFGCKQVIFKLDGDGNCVHIHQDKLATVTQFPMHGWTNTQFRRMAMLSGCDYLPSIPGIGLKKAHSALRRYKTVEKVLMQLRLEGAHKVPDNYIQAFNQAELAFMHQRIYCPKEMRLRPINDFPDAGLGEEDERWIGLDVTLEIAQGMANGEIHPETRIPIVDEWPDYRPGVKMIASESKGSTGAVFRESSKVNVAPKKKGPMDAFVQRKKVMLPKPVGVKSSGPSRLSDLASQSAPAASGSRSKFFGTASTPASTSAPGPSRRSLTKWPSGEGHALEHEKLVWDKSDEAGPEVDIESPIKPLGRSTLLVRTADVQSSPIRSPSPIVSSNLDKSSPTRTNRIHGTSPDGPNLSSPPDISPKTRGEVKLERMLSSPPDIGVKRSLSELDPFSPSPSPKPASGYVLYETSRSTPRISSQMDSQTPTKKGTMTSKGVDGRMVMERLRVAKRELGIQGSSDEIEEDEVVVTPSLEWGRAMVGNSQTGRGGVKGKGRVEREEEGDEGDDVVMIDDEEEDEEEVRRKVEEERRVEKAKSVALGWRSKFALNSGNGVGSQSNSPRISEPALKRRKTEPTSVAIPVKPSTQLSSSFPTSRTQTQTSSTQRQPRVATPAENPSVSTPNLPTSTRRSDSTKSIQLPKQNRAMPLSAFAPRILTSKTLNTVVLPSSPEEVRRDRVERAKNGEDGKSDETPRVIKAQGTNENLVGVLSPGRAGITGRVKVGAADTTPRAVARGVAGGGGGLSRFMFSGEVVRTREVL